MTLTAVSDANNSHTIQVCQSDLSQVYASELLPSPWGYLSCCDVRIIFPQQMKLPELKSVADILNEGRPLSNEVHTVPSVGGIQPDLFPRFSTYLLLLYLPPSLFLLPSSSSPVAERSDSTCCPHAGADEREEEDTANVPTSQGQ